MEDFINSFIAGLQTILRDSNSRLLSPSDDALKKGIWYGSEYYRVLKSRNKKNQIARMAAKGSFFHGHLEEEAFLPLFNPKSPTQREPLEFVLKKKYLPSLAINKIEEGLSLLDCGTVIMLAVYKALLAYLGQTKFDKIFAHPFPLSLNLNRALIHLMPRILISKKEEIQKGDICYFSNIEEYVFKHPAGESRGDYQVCLSSSPHLYIGFGLSSEGITQEEVEAQLWDCYNREPLDPHCFTPKVWDYLYSHYYNGDIERAKKLVESLRPSQITWEDFKKKRSRAESLGHPCTDKLALWVHRFDLKKIDLLKMELA